MRPISTTRILAGLLCLLTSCAQPTPTEPATADTPRLNGGWVGGGGRTDTTGVTVTSSDGGGWVGGGGKVAEPDSTEG